MRKYTIERSTLYQNIFRSNFTKTSIMATQIDGSKNFQNLKEELLNSVVSKHEGALVIGGTDSSNSDNNNNSRGVGDIIPQ